VLPEVTRENWENARAVCQEARKAAAAAAAYAAYAADAAAYAADAADAAAYAAARREVFDLAAGLLKRMCLVTE
jgi:hypothetical protein